MSSRNGHGHSAICCFNTLDGAVAKQTFRKGVRESGRPVFEDLLFAVPGPATVVKFPAFHCLKRRSGRLCRQLPCATVPGVEAIGD